MSRIITRRYRAARRWPSVLLMAAVSVGLVWLAGWGYTALRAAYIAPPTVVPVSVEDAVPVPVEKTLRDRFGVLSIAHTRDEQIVVVSVVRGYKSDIRVRSVFAPNGETLLAMQVLAQDETEYLGERVQTDAFAAQFAGRRAPLKLWQAATVGSPIDALSGATISSQAVVDAVNNAHAAVKTIL